MIEATARLAEFAENHRMTFFLWLRWITVDKLLNAHRYHLGTQKRNVAKEVMLRSQPMPDACSISLAQQLLGQLTSPTQAVQRAELQLIVQDTLNRMDAVDREVLVLRHFEQLSTSETAEVLGIKRSTAGKRYIAALKRLKQALSSVEGLNPSEGAG